jgi:hypothetical protein
MLFHRYLVRTLRCIIYSTSTDYIRRILTDELEYSIAAKLAPTDPEIAFNLAAVLEASMAQVFSLSFIVTKFIGYDQPDASKKHWSNTNVVRHTVSIGPPYTFVM